MPGFSTFFFNRSLAQFKNAFGSPNSRYWIGLDTLHNLTRSKCVIRFDLQLTNGTWFYAHYNYFTVGDPSTGYALNITGYSGNLYDAMAHSNGRKFTTYDADFDSYSGNCALYFGGGFWHNYCVYAHITTGPLLSAFFQWDDGTKMNLLNQTEARLTC